MNPIDCDKKKRIFFFVSTLFLMHAVVFKGKDQRS